MTLNEPTPLPAGGSVSVGMLETWRLAITHPNEGTYLSLSDDPQAGVGRAVAWTALASLISWLLTILGQWIYGGLSQVLLQLQESAPSADLTAFTSAGLALLLCAAPFAAVAAVIGLLCYAAVLQFVAGAFGGQGTFGRMAYMLAAYGAPMTVVTSLLSLIPIINLCLGLPLTVYGFGLAILSVKAVNRFSWGKALATFGVLFLLTALLALVLGLLVFRLAEPYLGPFWPTIQAGAV